MCNGCWFRTGEYIYKVTHVLTLKNQDKKLWGFFVTKPTLIISIHNVRPL